MFLLLIRFLKKINLISLCLFHSFFIIFYVFIYCLFLYVYLFLFISNFLYYVLYNKNEMVFLYFWFFVFLDTSLKFEKKKTNLIFFPTMVFKIIISHFSVLFILFCILFQKIFYYISQYLFLLFPFLYYYY